jgi:hypothetical protein
MGQCEFGGKPAKRTHYLFLEPELPRRCETRTCNTELHSTKVTVCLTASPMKIFLSQEDAIIIAKSKNACPDDIIPDDVSIKMHMIEKIPLFMRS